MNPDRILSAALFATMQHDGQRDIAGLEPYVAHPLRAAARLAKMGGTEDEIVAELLHDVVEDTPTRLDEIERRFGENVARMVDGVTKRRGERYLSLLRRAVAAGAGRVKLCDVLDNIDDGRLATVAAIDPERADRLRLKYAQALLSLSGMDVNLREDS